MGWLTQRFELSRGGSSHNVRAMEGLRGFAVFLVFLVHYMTFIAPWIVGSPRLIASCDALHTIGGVGVDLFFVLSGYLIYGSLIVRRQHIVKFMGRRIQRIYPTFVVVLAIYVVLSFIFPAESKIPSSVSDGTIYLVQNLLLLPGLLHIQPIITVAWTLSYEMFYYLVIPIIIGLFGLGEHSSLWRVLFFSVISVATIIYCATFGGPILLIVFVSGILLYEAVNSKRIPIPSNSFGLFALVIGLLSTLLPSVKSEDIAVVVGILFAALFIFCLACFRNPVGWLARLFSWTPLRWLGNMSYSYYLLHGLALKASFVVLASALPASESYGPWTFWILLPIMFGLTVISAAILFLAIERPFSLVRSRSTASGRVGGCAQSSDSVPAADVVE
ncbi:MAG: acyltransferase [Propionivibrio sp.]|uniref:acyltransferase family protein n=1 Tax=Propionivibrio sp. TaxID=2212460 RepID=UPI0025CF3790|nr:acyltransferase [Propionivibrio sp.]MBK8893859.1 acyltransferase [Propionivibrio sp.]